MPHKFLRITSLWRGGGCRVKLICILKKIHSENFNLYYVINSCKYILLKHMNISDIFFSDPRTFRRHRYKRPMGHKAHQGSGLASL